MLPAHLPRSNAGSPAPSAGSRDADRRRDRPGAVRACGPPPPLAPGSPAGPSSAGDPSAAANSRSSNPASATSSGTRSPRAWMLSSAPAAVASFAQKMASTPRSSSSIAPDAPEALRKSPSTMSPSVESPARSIARSIPGDAIFTRHGAAPSGDVADPAPPGVHQVRRDAVRGLDVIDVDVARGAVGAAMTDEHRGEGRRQQPVDQRILQVVRGDDDALRGAPSRGSGRASPASNGSRATASCRSPCRTGRRSCPGAAGRSTGSWNSSRDSTCITTPTTPDRPDASVRAARLGR